MFKKGDTNCTYIGSYFYRELLKCSLKMKGKKLRVRKGDDRKKIKT